MASTATSVPFGLEPWQWNTLQQLGSQGKLYGVPPGVMAAELRYQNGIAGGGIAFPVNPNSNGYGLFGLGPTTYDGPTVNGQPTSYSVTSSQLKGSSTQDFASLAQVSAASIAGWQQKYNGSLPAALAKYDGPPNTPSNDAVYSLYQAYITGSPAAYGYGTGTYPSGNGAVPSSSSSSSPATTGGILGDCTAYRNGAKATSNCLVGGGSAGLPVVGKVVSFPCLLNACQAKALVGGVLVLAGGVTMVVGIAVLARNVAPKVALSALRQGKNPVNGAAGVSEDKAQEREAAAHSQGMAEGRRMANLGYTTPSGSSGYVPTPEEAAMDADWAVA